MDDHNSGGRAAPTGEEQAGSDAEYTFGGRLGEDFGPLPPPGPVEPVRPSRTATRERPPRVDPADLDLRTDLDSRPRRGATGPAPRPPRSPVNRGALLRTALGVVVVACVAIVGWLAREQIMPLAGTAPAPEPTPLQVGVVPAASPAPTSAASPTPLQVGAAPAGSPTPLPRPTFGSTVAPARSSPAAVVPTPPAIVGPSGARFPTPTPPRGATPVRSPPPIPTLAAVNLFTRVWSERTLHQVGDEVSICAQAASGAVGKVSVLAPDRSTRALGEIRPPADKTCYTMRADQPGLYVLSLNLFDATGREVERQSAALWVNTR